MFFFFLLFSHTLSLTPSHTPFSISTMFSAGRLCSLQAELVPVDPMLARKELLQGNEGLPQQGVLPEGSVPEHPQVDHPLLQIAAGDSFIHQLCGEEGTCHHIICSPKQPLLASTMIIENQMFTELPSLSLMYFIHTYTRLLS